MEGDFEGGDPSQGISQSGLPRRGHAGVRDDDGVAGEFHAVTAQERSQAFASHFLLAFDYESEVAGEGGSGAQVGFDSFEVGEVLAFVVAGPTSEYRTASNSGIEGRRFPTADGVRRLDSV